MVKWPDMRNWLASGFSGLFFLSWLFFLPWQIMSLSKVLTHFLLSTSFYHVKSKHLQKHPTEQNPQTCPLRVLNDLENSAGASTVVFLKPFAGGLCCSCRGGLVWGADRKWEEICESCRFAVFVVNGIPTNILGMLQFRKARSLDFRAETSNSFETALRS